MFELLLVILGLHGCMERPHAYEWNVKGNIVFSYVIHVNLAKYS